MCRAREKAHQERRARLAWVAIGLRPCCEVVLARRVGGLRNDVAWELLELRLRAKATCADPHVTAYQGAIIGIGTVKLIDFGNAKRLPM